MNQKKERDLMEVKADNMEYDPTNQPRISKGQSAEKSAGNKVPKVRAINLDKLVPFANHPFQLYEGERLSKLADSIKDNGLLNPIVVRSNADDGFEILSGHNRVEAVRLLGQDKINAIVMDDLTDEAAERIVIESNLNQQSFSDWKFSQQIKVIKVYSKFIQENSQQGKRSDLEDDATCVHGEHKSADKPTRPKSRDKISKQLGISSSVFERYRSIAKLGDEAVNFIGEMLDDKRLGFMSAYRNRVK
jgi:ParB family chromosome partitioning protein